MDGIGDGSPFGRGEPAGATIWDAIPDLAASLESLRRRASAVQEVARSAAAGSPPPASVAGTDATESVTVVVGADGLPESLRVAPGWERRLRPEQLALAITEAVHAARSRQMAPAADALQDLAQRGQASSTRADLSDHGDRAGSSISGQGPYSSGSASLDSLAERALKLFSEVEEFRPVPVRGTGQAAGGRFTVTLSAEGAVSCSVDPRWASGQPAAALADAFRDAVRGARSALARERPAASPASALKGLFDETVALLRDPRRLT